MLGGENNLCGLEFEIVEDIEGGYGSFEIADRRLDTKNESIEIGQSENTINVPNCISAIELRHLCKNENFKIPEEIDIPLGFGIFWEIIVPVIIDITRDHQ